ncbi:RNA methyltransferase, TrmH family [Pseudobacteriovorax antillogorgiicola]|uniref:RNA methyltransferase, TrmH family n=3 Tax=Pseudobacteriovorax antillogorgiicola TaxID=1513793 RepID=A0A1Y6B3F0_9BACT|nr:TrmH family RNA methyltransferase [Pseudobacteriovorax antillogorgiicola]SME88043.1 RNA methyltransferase, TrmH family [Pseudobacteriovorax antillogorgiicola]
MEAEPYRAVRAVSSFGTRVMIESLKNQKIKDLIKLRDGKHRRRMQRFLLEGDRETDRAIRNGIQVLEIYACKASLGELGKSLVEKNPDLVTWVSPAVFEKIALRDSTGGLCSVGQPRYAYLDDLPRENLFLIVAEGLEKPGNLGAILRTADGAGADGLVLLDETADLYNPNCIRASLGAAFSVPVIRSRHQEFLDFCQQHKVQLVTASPHSDSFYYGLDLKSSAAIVLGSEAHGLSGFWESHGTAVKIPMLGVCDSLNVSVSAAILAYEVRRQRS